MSRKETMIGGLAITHVVHDNDELCTDNDMIPCALCGKPTYIRCGLCSKEYSNLLQDDIKIAICPTRCHKNLIHLKDYIVRLNRNIKRKE